MAVKNTCKLIADDAVVFGDVSKEGTNILNDIDNLQSWSDTSQLLFNEKKCKSLHIVRNNPEQIYNMDEHILEDVIVDRELKFHKQTAAAVKKANQVLGIIKKTIYTKSKISIPLVYASLVRPHLEYADAVWEPHYKMDQQKIERVQGRATKLIREIKDLSYEEHYVT